MSNYTILKSFLITGLILALFGCSPIRKTIITEKVEVIQRDSTVIKDSIVVTPVEKVVEIAPDTLYMETTLAKARAYFDTTICMLRGNMENKQQLVQKIEYRDKYVFRDSIECKEVPVEVKKEVKVKNKTNGFLLGWFVASIISIIIFILKKFTRILDF